MTEHDGSHLSSILQQGQGLPGVDIGLEGVTVRLPARTRETMLLFSIVSIVASLTLLLLGGLWIMLPNVLRKAMMCRTWDGSAAQGRGRACSSGQAGWGSM